MWHVRIGITYSWSHIKAERKCSGEQMRCNTDRLQSCICTVEFARTAVGWINRPWWTNDSMNDWYNRNNPDLDAIGVFGTQQLSNVQIQWKHTREHWVGDGCYRSSGTYDRNENRQPNADLMKRISKQALVIYWSKFQCSWWTSEAEGNR